MARISSKFYRIEKNIGDGFISVIEFHTVVNGKMYIREHEELDGQERWRGKAKDIHDKETGNKIYKRYLSNGYKFTGVYVMDILGYKEKLQAGM